MTAFVKAIAGGDEDFNLILLYGSRIANSILFHQEFDELAARCDKINPVYVLSHEEKDEYEHSFVTTDLIRKYAPEGDYSAFLCGP